MHSLKNIQVSNIDHKIILLSCSIEIPNLYFQHYNTIYFAVFYSPTSAFDTTYSSSERNTEPQNKHWINNYIIVLKQ